MNHSVGASAGVKTSQNDEPYAVTLGRFVAELSPQDLPDHVIAIAKGRLLDAISTAIASRGLTVPTIAQKFIQGSTGKATIVGARATVSPVDAAFVNAVLINGTTHDDFVAKSHAGATVIPAALASAEACGASGAEFVAAIVLGYDICARAYFGGPSMLPRFRATGVCGAIGAAAAAAKVMGLDAKHSADAIALSTMFASGFGEGFLAGTTDVKLNVGWASRSGLSAATLAQCGATAAPTIFEGKSGFFAAFSNTTEHAAALVKDLGQKFYIEDAVYKERPVCVFVQTPVHIAKTLVAEETIDPSTITAVRIRAPLETLTNPGYQNIHPYATALQARISVRFTVAATILGRPVETYKYFDKIDDAEVLELSNLIELLPPGDDHTVNVDIQCGERTYSKSGVEMDSLRPSWDKTVAKYRRLTTNLAPERADEILDLVSNIERAHDVARLAAALSSI